MSGATLPLRIPGWYDGACGIRGHDIAFLVAREMPAGTYDAILNGRAVRLDVRRSPQWNAKSHRFMRARCI